MWFFGQCLNFKNALKSLIVGFQADAYHLPKMSRFQAFNFLLNFLKCCRTEAGEAVNDVKAFTVDLEIPSPFDGNHICISHKLPQLLGNSPSEQTIFPLLLLKACWCAGKNIRALLIYLSVPLTSTSHLKSHLLFFFLMLFVTRFCSLPSKWHCALQNIMWAECQGKNHGWKQWFSSCNSGRTKGL